MIRITGGVFRSRLLKTPDSNLTKPTMDKVRLGVFSSISNDVINSEVLDLFAGSGSYSFEALSRGASKATLVDLGVEQIRIINDNARALGVEVKTLQKDVIDFLRSCNSKYDLIFLDPPYKLDIYENTIELIINNKLLNENGIIVVESEKELSFDEKNFKKIKMYKYGLARIYVLRK